MIPKVIHYCWFGGTQLPDTAKKCIESWKKYCPDYKIVEWNETNYDYTKNEYMLDAYKAGKWAFVPDYARLDIIYSYGGVYMDTDVELIKSIDDIVENNEAYFGMEFPGLVALGLGFAATPHNSIIKLLLDDYQGRTFINSDGSYNLTPSPFYQKEVFNKLGIKPENVIQEVSGAMILPTDYLCPKSFADGKLRITENTFSIHHFDGSWLDERQKFKNKIKWKYGKAMPEIIIDSLTIIKFDGIMGLLQKMWKKVFK